MITISHTHAGGTLISGSSKGDGVYDVLRGLRDNWRYFPSIRQIGLGQTRDHPAKRYLIDRAAEALQAAGFMVSVDIDDTPRDVTEVKADRSERLGDRQEALERKAGKLQASALAHLAEADRITAMRPFGQPILVGHHSEAGARADQRRIERNMDKFCEEYGQAKETARRASVVGEADAYRERPPVIIRRIAKTEADIRQCRKWMDAGYDRERYTARIAWLETQLEADQAALKAAQEAGYQCHSRDTIHKGDLVHMHGRQWEVVRVSAKSVSVKTDYSWTDTVSYERIREVTCTHAQASA